MLYIKTILLSVMQFFPVNKLHVIIMEKASCDLRFINCNLIPEDSQKTISFEKKYLKYMYKTVLFVDFHPDKMKFKYKPKIMMPFQKRIKTIV